MTDAPGILAVPSLREVFASAVHAVMDAEGFAPGPPTTDYLVDLLCEYVNGVPPLEAPPSVILAGSRHQRLTYRVRRLRELGDRSLYTAGYFRPSLRSGELDLDYYRAVGGGAYRRLSHLLRHRQQSVRLRRVFAELAEEFVRFVDLLSLVRSEVDASMTGDVAALYEEWLRTGSDALRRRLRGAGLRCDPKDAKRN